MELVDEVQTVVDKSCFWIYETVSKDGGNFYITFLCMKTCLPGFYAM
jgi:hypothetical protein